MTTSRLPWHLLQIKTLTGLVGADGKHIATFTDWQNAELSMNAVNRLADMPDIEHLRNERDGYKGEVEEAEKKIKKLEERVEELEKINTNLESQLKTSDTKL